jgi:3-mercaptopyruvate sulfurtransferase SseA
MTTRRTFALTALTLGAAAPLASTPFHRQIATLDVDELARAIAHGTDHIDALDLAEWIRDRRPGLRVIDLRRRDQFEAGHIPTAENALIDALHTIAPKPGETIVLYSEGGAHAGQAWVLLRALGHERVFFLRAGLFEWDAQVMAPTLASDATDAERREFDRAAELSKYFGGEPRQDVPRAQLGITTRELRRRGC